MTITDSTGASQTVLLDDGRNAGQIRGVNNQNLLFNDDADGNLVVTLPNGSQSSYSYDSKDNLTQQTNLLGQKTKFTYDATFNQLTSFTDPKGNGVGYSYDTKANLNKITYSDGSTQQFTVDALGNITSYINRRGSNISYTYNTSGLLTKKQYGNSSSVNYSYDTRGNLTSVVDGTGTMAMQYDTANRLTKITYPNGRSLSYTYNADGQRTKLVSSDGYTTNYTYDTVGRLKSLTNGTGQNIITYDYDSAGRLIKETNGNGTYTTYEYDLQDQLTKLVNYKANNTVNSQYQYTYDNLGRRTTMTTLEGVFEYGYDAIGQLTSVITPTNRTITYTYDAAGNRIGVTDSGVTTNYTTNNLNQYSNVGNGVYTYDTDGNLISKTQGGQTSNYTYDAESRLVKVVTPLGTWDYEYDGLGNRTATIFNGQKTEYLVDPFGLGDVVGEYNNNSLVANYTHGIGLVSRVNGNNSNYYDADAIGSTVGLTATDGSYVNKYSYLPFGEDLTKIEAVANPFEYVGQWGVTDEGNGLDFMRARFYDSSLGRFTSVDPIGLNGGDTNFYRYVFNSPNTLIDPSGLSCDFEYYISTITSKQALSDISRFVANTVFLISSAALVFGASGLAAQLFVSSFVWKLFNAGINNNIDKFFQGETLNLLAEFNEFSSKLLNILDLLKTGQESYTLLREFIIFNNYCNDEKIPVPPPLPGGGGGGSWGDPHLTTFDGIKYDFQSVGEFTLVKSTTDDFEIQTRQQPWNGSTSVSVNSAIAIKLGGQRIGFYLNDPNPLKINGIAANLPNGQLYAIGQNLIVRDGDSYSIFSANNDYINIDFNSTYININLGLAENRKGNLIGLLGNYNGTTNDDFALRNGTVIGGTITTGQLYGEYDDSWRITQATSLFDYGTGQNTNTFTDLTFPNNVITIDSLTPAQRAAAEQIAINAGITDPDILNDAILDIFLTNGAPEIIQGYVTRQRQATISATNTLINPEGFGDQHWLTSGEVIPYTIRFTNNAAAGTIPVAQVTITQTLDSDLDLNTFTLQDFGFGNITVNVPVGTRNYSQRLDLRTTRGVFVDVNASLNTSTRVLTWTFIAIDPTTGNPANITTQGFLPPNDANGSGTGFVGYSIQPKANNPTNTRIDAQASITLNTQTIQTNPVFNTVGDTSVTLAVSPASVTEDGTANLIYTFTRSGVLTNALTVNYTLGGTATLNTDYTRSGTNNTVTFAANSTTAKVTVDPTADTTVETDETVILTLASGTGYTIGTTTPVTGTIKNDDTNVTLPSVTLAVSPASVTEDGTANLIYTFTRSGVLTNALTVNYSISGTATNGSDYAALPTSIAFAAGLSTATVIVDPTADTIVESNETVTLTLASGTGYKVGTTPPVTGTITNDDFPQLSINNITVVEGLDNNAILTVTVDNPNPQPITFNYTTGPIDATANVDYTSKTGTITIAANTATATISIPLLNDNLNEPDEVFTVTLSNPVNATINPEGGIGEVIITDTWQSSLTRTLPNNVENLRLIGSNNINGTGNAGNNNITGNSGNNQINGRAGIDTLTGGLGADTFVFQFGQSTISTSDRITDFAINSDKIDLLTQAGNATSAPSNFSRAANSTVTTLQNLINQVFTDANGAITGNQGLGVNSAALVQVTTGAIAGTYLVINDSTAAFQSSNDLLINITGFTGTLPALGNIPVGNFFV
ncbi:Calx-beta domain-containing protein [Microcystis aeruginosa]|uniref:Cell wall-associated polypeptide CWBP200 n=1 Tax=Microcystis aeruginosa SPC777 TaxID=482300 RepID=S3K1B2_MICAE|nr:Calx-beta domain-containing protein [Microcystis aeruginosa]EPF19029.1 Cell wall-associated polypeptide CWBP200 [Microcystis aeruginosa SPC777]